MADGWKMVLRVCQSVSIVLVSDNRRYFVATLIQKLRAEDGGLMPPEERDQGEVPS